MKYARGHFTNEYYHLWMIGLLIPVPENASVYSVKYRKNHFDEYSRVTLKAISISDALERACYATTYASPWRPEDIDLHAVYDSEENLLWLDEPFYELVQKKNEFRGMERREFLAKFGATSAAILFGFRPGRALAGSTVINLSGTASNFLVPGEQLYTTSGNYSWSVPGSVTSCCAVCIGGGSGGYGSESGGGGQLRYLNNIAVTPGATIPVVVGVGGSHVFPASSDAGGASSFNSMITATGGGGSTWSAASSGGSGGVLGGNGGAGRVAGGSGGGGAGGYSGDGGLGGLGSTSSPGSGSAGSGGAGGGGSGGTYHYDSENGMVGVMAGGGGGVGLNGQGANGTAGVWSVNTSQGGGGGSGGAAGLNYYDSGGYGRGGAYGGGGACAGNGNIAGAGGSGAVRIIWGIGRSFPSNAS